MTLVLSPGDRIADKYRILRTLGTGGMGVVYLAHHERLDRQVAIKLLHAQLEQQSVAVKRFEREIKAMALVNNRHIAHALDADVLDDGSLFLVMEYLEGHNLRAELKARGAIPFAEAVAYVIQACQGIAALHELGIVHRDLKPANLFLTELRGARCIKVLDFGIVKFLEGQDGAVTEGDVSLGTPYYMSPEQLRSPDEVSPRSDVWALGVLLYELIAGLSPFAAGTPGAVVAAIMFGEPVPLSTLVPEVPEELARIVTGALNKEPQFRVGSARELAALLAPFGMPTDAIRVAASRSPAQRPRPLTRTSVRPKLSADMETKIEPKVEAFGMATDRPTVGLGAVEPFGSARLAATRPTTGQVQVQPQRRLWALTMAGILVLLSALSALGSGPPASGTAAASQPVRVPMPATPVARATEARPLSETPSFVDAGAQSPTPTSSALAKAAPSGSSPARQKPATMSARAATPTSGPSARRVAADGKPLHL